MAAAENGGFDTVGKRGMTPPQAACYRCRPLCCEADSTGRRNVSSMGVIQCGSGYESAASMAGRRNRSSIRQ